MFSKDLGDAFQRALQNTVLDFDGQKGIMKDFGKVFQCLMGAVSKTSRFLNDSIGPHLAL